MTSETEAPAVDVQAATASALKSVAALIREGTFPAVKAIDVVRALQWLDQMSATGDAHTKLAKAEKKRAVRAVKAVKAVPNG